MIDGVEALSDDVYDLRITVDLVTGERPRHQ